MTTTAAKRKAWPEARLKEARSRLFGRLAGVSEARKSSETHRVEPGGARGKILHLTWGEISRRRSSEEAG